MANLNFVDQHNMVACLERTDGNAEFHQIVDFLTTNLIHYALTQIHAIVDGKKVVISESSMRSDLHFNDDDVEGEGSGQASEPQPPSSTAPPSHAKPVTTTASQPQNTHTPRRTKREEDDRVVRVATTATSLEAEQESGGHTPGSVEGRPNLNELMAICTQLSNRVLALEQLKTAQDLVINKLQNKVKRLENKKRERTSGMNLFKIGTFRSKSLDKENVSKQGRNLKTRLMFEEGNFDDDFDDIVDEATTNVEGDTVNAGGAVNTATTGVSAASASVATADMRSEKAKEKGVAFRDVEESARPTKILSTIDPKDKDKGIIQEPEKPPKNLRKYQIQLDEELAKRFHEEELVELKKRQSKIAAAEEASKAAIN
nr:hypothetical protein [Tanacetum cinerariifolium]